MDHIARISQGVEPNTELARKAASRPWFNGPEGRGEPGTMNA
jgi:hypothetical protein